MDNVHCLNPWDPQSKRQYMIDGVYATLNAGQAIGGQAHGICYEQNGIKCLNPWDSQTNRQYDPSGIYPALQARERSGQTQSGICYAIEGNIVDRVSNKNGKGWCEDVSPTLNTQDRHAICFQLCGDRDNPSVSLSEKAYCIPANPMSDRGQAVCYKK